MILPVGFHAPRPDAPSRPLCRTKELHQIATTYRCVTCENCLYIADVQGRAQELNAAISFGTAAVFGLRHREAIEDIVSLAQVAAHFALRLLEEAA